MSPSGRTKVRERVRVSIWRRYRWPVAAVVLASLAIGLYVFLLGDGAPRRVRATSDDAPAERTAALPPLSFPADEGPHVKATEWWYYTGQVEGEGGERYAFHTSLFLRDGMVRHTVLHFSLTDLRSGKRIERQVRTAGIPSEVISAGFDFKQADWQVSSNVVDHVLKVDADGVKLALNLKAEGAAVLHRTKGSRTPGIIDFGEAGVSYYYSRPRLQSVGTVTLAGGKPLQVKGEVWFDHQWGDFDSSRQAWNWFALQLDDGSDLMIYQMYDAKGDLALLTATLAANGRVTSLSDAEIELKPAGAWRSAQSGVSYPGGWDVRTPFGVIQVRPEKPDSEFNGLESTFKYYWEGAVKVTGARSGKGFLEMSGYDLIKGLQPPK